MKDEGVSTFSELILASLKLMIVVDLPEPKLLSLSTTSTTIPSVAELAAKPPQRPATPPPAATSPSQKPRTMRKDSLEFPEADPWASPAMHKGHNHNASPSRTNGTSRATSNGVREPVRTTSNFTTASTEPSNSASNQNSRDAPAIPVAGVWGSYDGNSNASFNNSANSTIGGDGFGDSGGGDRDRPGPNAPGRSFGGGRVTGNGVEEIITVALLPEKEGMFMFQHHNYQVASPRRGSKVIRRYSDFVWLLDCLQKRYPFRQLPLLPPKRVGGTLQCLVKQANTNFQ
jgi:sorting nexin-8